MRTMRCPIEDVETWYPRLFLEPHIVACVAVLSFYSDSPATFDVACEGIVSSWLASDSSFRLEIAWTERTAAKASRLLATMQRKPVVELASLALAFTLARRLIALGQLDVNDYGERADYRSLSAECVPSQTRGIASGFPDTIRWRDDMAKSKVKLYPASLLELMAAKTAVLMKARTFADMGMAETAQPMWAMAASCEERIAPLLDALGRDREAAASRISAASCYQKGGDPSRAANLYQAALAAPLRPNTQGRRDDARQLFARVEPHGSTRNITRKQGDRRDVTNTW